MVTRVLGRMVKRSLTRVMDKLGGKLVSGMADTSADAPSASYAPKRDHYSQVLAAEEAARAAARAAKAAPPAHDHGHDHGHDHDHGH